MAEAQLIPGATQVFADVLEGTGKAGSGNVQTLFANMQKGKYTLQDIVKVLDSLEGRIKQDLLDKALSRPAALMAEMQTAYQRLLAAINDSGALELMTASLKLLTDVLIDIKKWTVANKEELKEFFHEIKIGMKLLVAYAPELLTFYGVWKTITLGVNAYRWALKWALAEQAAFLAASNFVGPIAAATTYAEKFGLIAAAIAGVVTRMARLAFFATVVAVITFLVWSLFDLFRGKENVFTLFVDEIDRLSKLKDGGVLGFLEVLASNLNEVLSAAKLLVELGIGGVFGIVDNARVLDRKMQYGLASWGNDYRGMAEAGVAIDEATRIRQMHNMATMTGISDAWNNYQNVSSNNTIPSMLARFQSTPTVAPVVTNHISIELANPVDDNAALAEQIRLKLEQHTQESYANFVNLKFGP